MSCLFPTRAIALVVCGAIAIFLATPRGSQAGIGLSANPDTGSWGVSGGLIRTMVRVGDTIYVGGSFTSLVSHDGLDSLPAGRLAAFDANTGQPTNWRPVANGTVYALAAAPDGSAIYAGGAFTTIDDIPRSRFAAIAQDGSLLWSADAISTIKCIAVSGDTIYLGGNFRQILGQTRLRLAAIQPPLPGGTSAVLLPWSPRITSTNAPPSVIGLAVAKGAVVAVGSWTHVNDQPEPNQARLDAVTGAKKLWANNVLYPATGVATDGTNFFGGFGGVGVGGRLIAWSPSGNKLWEAVGNGDVQAVTYFAGRVIAGGHFTKLRGIETGRLAAFTVQGDFDTSWQPRPNSGGDRGVWALHGAGKLYIGGGFLRVGGDRARSYAQFSDIESPTSPSDLAAVASSSTQVDLLWKASEDNVGVTGYDIYRDDTLLDSVSDTTSYSDTTVSQMSSYNYRINARDAASNVSDPSDLAAAETP